MRGPRLIISVSVCAALGCSIPLSGATAATQVLTYNVEHPTYGTIGTYTNIVSQNGSSADVRSNLHVAVKAVGIPLYHQDATREERWQNERLIAFDSTTDDNGTQIVVSGQADRTGFVIRSTSTGSVTAPPQVHPSRSLGSFPAAHRYDHVHQDGPCESGCGHGHRRGDRDLRRAAGCMSINASLSMAKSTRWSGSTVAALSSHSRPRKTARQSTSCSRTRLAKPAQ